MRSVSIRVEHVTKRFKDTHGREDVCAVRDADFTIEAHTEKTMRVYAELLAARGRS